MRGTVWPCESRAPGRPGRPRDCAPAPLFDLHVVPVDLGGTGRSSLFARLPDCDDLLARISRQGERSVREGGGAPCEDPAAQTSLLVSPELFNGRTSSGRPFSRACLRLRACRAVSVRPGRKAPHLPLRHRPRRTPGSAATVARRRAGSAPAVKRRDGRGAVTGRVGILGTISSASGKAAGETGDYPGPPGAPRKARPVPPGAMVVSGRLARQEAGDLATSPEFPRVHLMTPPARARQNDRGIVRLDTFRGRRRRGRLRHRKVGTFRRGGSPRGTGATREVTGLRGS